MESSTVITKAQNESQMILQAEVWKYTNLNNSLHALNPGIFYQGNSKTKVFPTITILSFVSAPLSNMPIISNLYH